MSRILVIDDEQGICEEFSDILSEEGHQVDMACSGIEGLKKFEETDYDLVFLDILMPRMDGTEVFEKIKAVKKTPVVIMSGFLPQGKGIEILAQGARAVLRKPLDLNAVLDIIRRVEKKND